MANGGVHAQSRFVVQRSISVDSTRIHGDSQKSESHGRGSDHGSFESRTQESHPARQITANTLHRQALGLGVGGVRQVR